eukprot:5821580-Amphidinium_carterae.1
MAYDEFVKVCEARHLLLHDCERGVDVLEVLGVVLDCPRRILRHKSRRVWRLYLSGRALCRRRRCCGVDLQLWLGHIVHAFTLCRPALSVLQYVYLVVRDYGRKMGCIPPE